jgi:hypothetical protein
MIRCFDSYTPEKSPIFTVRNMKKILVLILTFSYLASASGIPVYFQQCMGKTIAWSFTDKEKDQCAMCGMHNSTSTGCCQEQVKVLKVHNDQNLPEVYLKKIFSSPALPAGVFYSVRDHKSLPVIPETAGSYTPLRKDYCILYCSLLI